MAPHSSTLAWKIPWTGEPGGLQSMRSLGVGHDWATSLSLFTFMLWRRKWQPPPVFLPGESQGWGAWWASVYGVAQSRTWLRRLSSSSSSIQNLKKNPIISHSPQSLLNSFLTSIVYFSFFSQMQYANNGMSFNLYFFDNFNLLYLYVSYLYLLFCQLIIPTLFVFLFIFLVNDNKAL